MSKLLFNGLASLYYHLISLTHYLSVCDYILFSFSLSLSLSLLKWASVGLLHFTSASSTFQQYTVNNSALKIVNDWIQTLVP